jgi:hypothetical protein
MSVCAAPACLRNESNLALRLRQVQSIRRDPLNHVIQDNKLAPRNSDGTVSYWTDACAGQPECRQSHDPFDTVNRGTKEAPAEFNVDRLRQIRPPTASFESQGYTAV